MNKYSGETIKVLDQVRQFGPVRAIQLRQHLKVSTKTLYKHLARLLDDEAIIKTGSVPRVYYRVNEVGELVEAIERNVWLESEYVYVTPTGEIIRGTKGFYVWCQKNKLDFGSEKALWLKRFKTIKSIKRHSLISGGKRVLAGKGAEALDGLYFSDFYTFDHFGKTKLGQLVYLGKSAQNTLLIREVAELIKPQINYLLTKYEIGFVCFIPPTINRKIQFMEVLKQGLNLGVEELVATKVPAETMIAQKTLRKLADRIENARGTIVVDAGRKIQKNVLIIDDATGSGATMNETAKKIRKMVQGKIRIIGYSVVGSFKGYAVISEV